MKKISNVKLRCLKRIYSNKHINEIDLITERKIIKKKPYNH